MAVAVASTLLLSVVALTHRREKRPVPSHSMARDGDGVGSSVGDCVGDSVGLGVAGVGDGVGTLMEQYDAPAKSMPTCDDDDETELPVRP